MSSRRFVFALGAAAALSASLFFLVILGTLLGAVSGWIVGLVFGDIILAVLGRFGVHDVSMWQVGAFLGFVGPFFRATLPQAQR